MKKLLLVLAAGVLVFGAAGQAMAAFSAGDLIRISYDTSTGVEIATDFGSISSLQGLNNVTIDNLTLSEFNDTSSNGWADVNTAYISYNTGPTRAYVSGTAAPVGISGAGVGSLETAISNVFGHDGIGTAVASTTASFKVGTGDSLSYYTQVDVGGTGHWANEFTTSVTGPEANNATRLTQFLYLATKSGTSGTVAQVLNSVSNPVTDFTITTLDGSTVINQETPSAAPIPPSILLMGSGLLGLVGIGRRKFFA
ncbi:MAG: hypothetical protein ACLQVJ_02015 [Syntrophobacteraceae bacterium]